MRPWKNRHNVPTNLPHNVLCTECPAIFSCACTNPGKHQERRDRGWKVLCPDCNKKDLGNWSEYLKSAPETRTFEPLPERRDG